MESADELAGRCKVGVLLPGHFQCIGHERIAVRRICHASRFSTIEPEFFSFAWSQIQSQQGIELMRILDRCDRSRPEHSIRLVDACAVVRLDTVEIELHHPRRCQIASQDRRLNILDRGFFDLEVCRLRRDQRRREKDERC